MDLESLLSRLQLPSSFFAELAKDWLPSRESLADFLTPATLREVFPLTGLAPTLLSELEAALDHLLANPAERLLAWHAHRKLSVGESPRFHNWPDLPGLSYLLVGISMIPLIKAAYGRASIPSDLLSCCEAIRGMCATYQARHGAPGISRVQLHWLRHYLDLNCFRIGRLEFMVSDALQYDLAIYRHRTTGEIVAGPSRMSVRLGSDGLFVPAEEAICSGAFVRTPQGITTLVYDPRGHATGEAMTLGPEWEVRLPREGKVLGLHIPQGGGLTLEACRDAFTRAFAFFETRHPGNAPDVIACTSWIFSPQYEAGLPDSNLAKLMREVYLYPAPSNGKEGLFFVFGRDDPPYDDDPAATSLQRFMLGEISAGRPLRSGSMFLLKEHLPLFGTQFYRKRNLLFSSGKRRILPT